MIFEWFRRNPADMIVRTAYYMLLLAGIIVCVSLIVHFPGYMKENTETTEMQGTVMSTDIRYVPRLLGTTTKYSVIVDCGEDGSVILTKRDDYLACVNREGTTVSVTKRKTPAGTTSFSLTMEKE